jgi:predicted ABC-type ATPase
MIALLDRRPLLVALAGPNGAGKSTFYHSQLAESGLRFVNADQLALHLRLAPYGAAELADKVRRELVAKNESFIFETVFSDPAGNKLRFLQDAEKSGYNVVLFFIGIDGPETSEARVTMRVLKGGHDVPTDKIKSRYARTMVNLQRALVTLSNVFVHDNSDLLTPYRLVAARTEGELRIHPPVPGWLEPLLPPR